MRLPLLLLAALLLAPAAGAAVFAGNGPHARVELASMEGAWNGLSCMGVPEGRAAVDVWVPRGARVHEVTASDGTERRAAAWGAAGRDALRVETPNGTREACASFDVPQGGGGVVARFVAPEDLAGLGVTLAPPEGDVLQVDGEALPPAGDGAPQTFSVAGMRRGEALTLRVVDEGRVGELPLLLTLGGLSLLVLAGTLVYHAVRPPLEGRPAVRFLEHLAELQARLLPVAALFALLNVIFFTMGLRLVHVGSVPLVAPTFGVEASVSSRAFDAFAERLVPPDVALVALRPVDAVLAQVQTSLFLAFVAVLPLLLYEVGAFVGPGLEPRERRAVLATLPVLSLLFLAGALFGYLVMAPFMLATLYGYAPALQVEALLGVGDLVGFALLIMLAFALAFELPVAMYALARFGLVKPASFLRYFRHAVLVIVIAAGILTPDPSVVSQLLVAGPVIGLYLLGTGVSYFGERRRAARLAAA